MHPDIQKAIEFIDRKITGLQRAKQALITEFGDGTVHNEKPVSQPAEPQKREKNKPTRKEEVVQLLQLEGPLSRKDIVKKSGIPAGTVAYTLNAKETFESKNGKWRLKTIARNRISIPSQVEEFSSAVNAETP